MQVKWCVTLLLSKYFEKGQHKGYKYASEITSVDVRGQSFIANQIFKLPTSLLQ